jgi:hypothetical protein
MNNVAAKPTLPTITRKTLDGFPVVIEDGELGTHRATFTRHAPLRTVADVLELAEAVSLFERAEMPSLATAAAKLSKRGPLSLWPLVEEAARLSHKAGTRPADVAPPMRTARVSVWTPEEAAARANGFVVAPRGTVAVKVAL